MCLDNTRVFFDKNNDIKGVGFVVARKTRKGFYRPCYRATGNDFGIGKEFLAVHTGIGKEVNILSGLGSAYPAGFHIFEKIQDARDYRAEYVGLNCVLLKVKYRDILCIGSQKLWVNRKDCYVDKEVVIAKYRTIIEEV